MPRLLGSSSFQDHCKTAVEQIHCQKQEGEQKARQRYLRACLKSTARIYKRTCLCGSLFVLGQQLCRGDLVGSGLWRIIEREFVLKAPCEHTKGERHKGQEVPMKDGRSWTRNSHTHFSLEKGSHSSSLTFPPTSIIEALKFVSRGCDQISWWPITSVRLQEGFFHSTSGKFALQNVTDGPISFDPDHNFVLFSGCDRSHRPAFDYPAPLSGALSLLLPLNFAKISCRILFR